MREEPGPADIIAFWREAGPEKWFRKDQVFDSEIRRRFEPVHHAAARGEHVSWEETADGALALVLLFDQFPRNLYRGSGHAYATDGLARRVAEEAIARDFDQQTDEELRFFFYMPFEHSESPADQARSIRLFESLGDEEHARYARHHAGIIAKFGRFPHRNEPLGRLSTAAEIKFLEDGGFAG